MFNPVWVTGFKTKELPIELSKKGDSSSIAFYIWRFIMLKKITQLSSAFYQDYDEKIYSQILRKKTRPYSIFTIELDNNIYAIPFKSNLSHNNGYLFKDSKRKGNPGLDFKKTVVILKKEYLDNEPINVDSNEARNVRMNADKIHTLFKKYIYSYKKYLLHPIEGYKIAGNYINTSLIYFLEEIGIKETEQLHLELKFSVILFYINNFLKKDGYFINFYFRKDKNNLYIEDKQRNLLFMLNNDNLSDYCFKESRRFIYEKRTEIR